MQSLSPVFEKNVPKGRFLTFNQRPEFPLARVKQTHSAIAVSEPSCSENLIEADAIVGQTTLPLAILTADCLPILILGTQGHAMVHAGWKGLHLEILRHELIAKIQPYYAFIGPHIQSKSYEVQPEFKDNFKSEPEAFIERAGHLYFDLSYVAKKQLLATYPDLKIEISGLDTFTQRDLHSYRRDKNSERNWNIYIP